MRILLLSLFLICTSQANEFFNLDLASVDCSGGASSVLFQDVERDLQIVDQNLEHTLVTHLLRDDVTYPTLPLSKIFMAPKSQFILFVGRSLDGTNRVHLNRFDFYPSERFSFEPSFELEGKQKTLFLGASHNVEYKDGVLFSQSWRCLISSL